MRRAFLAAAACGALLTLGACGSDDDKDNVPAAAQEQPSSSAPAVESSPPAPDYTANTEKVCKKVAAVYSDGFAGFHTQLGRMIANKEAKQADGAKAARKAAGEELKKVGTKIKKEVSAAEDPQLKKAGETSAAKVTKSASDSKFFDSIKTTKDLNAKIEPKILDWMTPVTGFCA